MIRVDPGSAARDKVHDDIARTRSTCRVRRPCKHENVRILTAEENVWTGATSDRIVAGASGDDVIPRTADQHIGPVAAGHFEPFALSAEIDCDARRSVGGRRRLRHSQAACSKQR